MNRFQQQQLERALMGRLRQLRPGLRTIWYPPRSPGIHQHRRHLQFGRTATTRASPTAAGKPC